MDSIESFPHYVDSGSLMYPMGQISGTISVFARFSFKHFEKMQ